MKLLFVCLGNICRSPTAHAVFRQLAAAENFRCEVESAGTSASHKGAAPDPRSINAASDYNFKGIQSRPVQTADFAYYDLILAMDLENLAALKRRCPPEQQHKLKLLMSYHPDFAKQQEIPDPYYGGIRGFELVLQMIQTSCEHLLMSLQQQAMLSKK
ncbi:low molecular weight protein-tyrosine-phosphatase [Rheinheimera sp. SA_1]|uniref:low molecular weight protein-tyrosine-phosphatase n=1 Tax=Rheinheimera sp. SA_1 TaxID=1827365 RepID=UPI0009ED5992|nr:low molecular weight protein-tyrosine-phosphatase [Rheinheimera sp. SA_1]